MRSRVILLSLFLHLASGPTARADYSDHRNRRVDSLENVLQSGQSLTDEERMLAYKGLMWGYQQTDGNRSAHYAREALRLSYAHDWLSARSDALRMLGMLSGKTHKVVTGVTITTAGDMRSFSVVTNVEFATLSDEDIAYYVQRYRPLDKAGAYGIQEWIGCMGVRHIDGSFYNVMGLPLHRLYTELDKLIAD